LGAAIVWIVDRHGNTIHAAWYQYGICAKRPVLVAKLGVANKLNFIDKMVEPDGIEPTTSSMPLKRSPN
jgi:hypothetical protein